MLKSLGPKKTNTFITDNNIAVVDRTNIKGVQWDGTHYVEPVIFRPSEYSDTWVVLETNTERQQREKVSSLVVC